MRDMEFSVLAECDSTDLFEGENINWQYCMGEDDHEDPNVTFTHKSACEFILHLHPTDEDHAREVSRMSRYGCTPEFIVAYNEARKAGARRILFYA